MEIPFQNISIDFGKEKNEILDSTLSKLLGYRATVEAIMIAPTTLHEFKIRKEIIRVLRNQNQHETALQGNGETHRVEGVQALADRCIDDIGEVVEINSAFLLDAPRSLHERTA